MLHGPRPTWHNTLSYTCRSHPWGHNSDASNLSGGICLHRGSWISIDIIPVLWCHLNSGTIMVQIINIENISKEKVFCYLGGNWVVLTIHYIYHNLIWVLTISFARLIYWNCFGGILVSLRPFVCVPICPASHVHSVASTVLVDPFHIDISYQVTSLGVSHVKFLAKFHNATTMFRDDAQIIFVH